MPRAANGTYSLPAGYAATPGTTILSGAQHNALWTDVRDTLNADFATIGYVKSFATMALLLADTSMTYSTVQQGQYIFVLESNRYFQVAPSAATDNDNVTAGSIKLYAISAPEVALKTPYDFGAIPGSEVSTDNSAAWNALMDACEASWDGTNEGFAYMPYGAGKMWRVDTGTRLIDCQNPGMVIRDATLVAKGTGNIGLDLFGSQNVTVYNVTVVGDRSDPPDIGIAYGRNNSGAVAPNIKLVNCRTRGKFNKFGRLQIASEVSTEIGCQWMNWSRSLTAFADGCVDHMQPLADHVGGVTSPNTTLRSTSAAAMSNTTHDWQNSFSLRQADFNLTVTGVTTGAATTIAFSTGTLAGAALSNGDKIVFSRVPVGSLFELTTEGPFTVASLNEAADTLVLSGVDSSSWSGSFSQATCQNQTGPVSLYAGLFGLRRNLHYSLCYGNVHHVVDMATGQGINDFEISALHERDPQSVVKLYKGSTNRIISGFRLRCLNYNQTMVNSCIDNSDGSAVLNFDNGYIHIPNQESDPADGLWSDPSTVVIRENFEEIVARETSLNDVADFSAYFGRRYMGNASRRYQDWSDADYYGDPRFVTEAVFTRAMHAYLSDDTATSGPFIDTIRDSASPAASDVIGAFRAMGKNSAGEDVYYASFGGLILDPTDGSEDGRIVFNIIVAGTVTTVAFLQSGGLFVNGIITQTARTTTAAALGAIGNAVNITGKYEGLSLWDTDTRKPVWADGAAAGDVWKFADGTTAYTPS